MTSGEKAIIKEVIREWATGNGHDKNVALRKLCNLVEPGWDREAMLELVSQEAPDKPERKVRRPRKPRTPRLNLKGVLDKTDMEPTAGTQPGTLL